MNSFTQNKTTQTAAVQKQAPIIQPKLMVNAPGDRYEQEADAMAERVMRMPEQDVSNKPKAVGLIAPSIQRKCSKCEEEERKKKNGAIMRKGEGSGGFAASSGLVSKLNATKGGGSPLPEGTKSLMENAFSADFSGVRVHTGGQASGMNREINAKAFTCGSDIYFNNGQYQADSLEGKRLLGHELVHVVQQKSGATTSIQRFGEREHKKLGDESKTTYPYYATLVSDEVGLRSSPEGSRPGNKFHNLIASLKKDVRLLVVGNSGKWMRVVAKSGTAVGRLTDKASAAVGLSGYVSAELLIRETGIFDQNLGALTDLPLTYGDFTSLTDHFAKFSDIEDKVKTDAGKAEVNKFRDVVAGRAKGEFEDPKTISEDWAERYKALAMENVSHFSHGGTALENWKKEHYRALVEAANGGYYHNISMLEKAFAVNGFADHFLTDSFAAGHVRVPRSLIIAHYKQFFNSKMDVILTNIYALIGFKIVYGIAGDHPYITSAGQLLGHDSCADIKAAATKIETGVADTMAKKSIKPDDLNKLMIDYIAGAVSKVLHDAENVAGLPVTSKKHPEGWETLGDGKLNTATQAYVAEAVSASKSELVEAFNKGVDFKLDESGIPLYKLIKSMVYPYSKIEDYIPVADPAKSKALPEWRIDRNQMDASVRKDVKALVNKYLDEKAMKDILGGIPESEEIEIDWSPNVTARPRAAVESVLLLFKDHPVGFIYSNSIGSADLDLAASRECVNFFSL